MTEMVRVREVVTNTKLTMFEEELERLINKYSLENGSDTTDFLLAGYLRSCLTVFHEAVARKVAWPLSGIFRESPSSA